MTVTTTEAADLLHVPPSTIRRWAKQGWITPAAVRHKPGRPPADVYDWPTVAHVHATRRPPHLT